MRRADYSPVGRLLKDAGLTQEACSRKSGVGVSLIRCIVHGRYPSEPGPVTIYKLAIALKVTEKELRAAIEKTKLQLSKQS